MEEKSCCAPKTNKNKGIFSGIIYGIIPHSFCIAYVVLSIIGATAGISIMKNFLVIPYFFQILVALSIVFATISAIIYLKRFGLLTSSGIKSKWRYLTILYGTVVGINLLFFFVIFPATANMDFSSNKNLASVSASNTTTFSTITLQVEIPCSGHAPLIIGELKKAEGINNAVFKMPNVFTVYYDSNTTSKEKILSLEIFKEFPAKAI